MKKITKATLAAGAGVALLLGTGGTLAYWNDSTKLAAAQISAGTLQVTQKSNPTWTIQHANGAVRPVTNIGSVRLVPGDRLVYSGVFDIAAQGDNLRIRAEVAKGAIAAADPTRAADLSLAGRVTANTAVQINETAVEQLDFSHLKSDAGTYPVTITATLEWPFGADDSSVAADNAAKQGRISLSDFVVNVRQIDGAVPAGA